MIWMHSSTHETFRRTMCWASVLRKGGKMCWSTGQHSLTNANCTAICRDYKSIKDSVMIGKHSSTTWPVGPNLRCEFLGRFSKFWPVQEYNCNWHSHTLTVVSEYVLSLIATVKLLCFIIVISVMQAFPTNWSWWTSVGKKSQVTFHTRC